MKIVVIGGTGLIGSKTIPILRQGGHEVIEKSCSLILHPRYAQRSHPLAQSGCARGSRATNEGGDL
jgi:NAD dependent epimerase/dehydratase family enzyme